MALSQAEYRKILVPLDGSGFAEVALPHAQAIAERTGATLVLVRVVEPLAYQLPPELRYVVDANALDKRRVEEAETYLRARAGELEREGFKVHFRLAVGAPVALHILQAIADEGVDLVVMSTHGTSGISRWFVGSVARQVLLTAPVPVLLIRAEEA